MPFPRPITIYAGDGRWFPAGDTTIVPLVPAMRFILNLIGGLALAAALVFAVADIARSLADGAAQLTSIGEAFAAVGLPLNSQEAGLSRNAVDLIALVSTWPASITFGLAAFLLLFVGRPRSRGRLAR